MITTSTNLTIHVFYAFDSRCSANSLKPGGYLEKKTSTLTPYPERRLRLHPERWTSWRRKFFLRQAGFYQRHQWVRCIRTGPCAWRVKMSAKKDTQMIELREIIINGFPNESVLSGSTDKFSANLRVFECALVRLLTWRLTITGLVTVDFIQAIVCLFLTCLLKFNGLKRDWTFLHP